MSVDRLGYSKDFVEYLDERNFDNLVRFYKPELLKIMNGVSPRKVLGTNVCRKFRKIRVFRDMRGSNKLSERALRILNDR